jgi:hypothetical protein
MDRNAMRRFTRRGAAGQARLDFAAMLPEAGKLPRPGPSRGSGALPV